MSAQKFAPLIPMRGMPRIGHFGPFFDVETDPNPPSVETVLTRFNGATVRMAERVTELEKDNYKQREELRDHKATIKDLEGKVPADGTLVLSADDATRWQAFQALNLAPADVTSQLTAAADATKERDVLKREKTIRQVAEETGLKPDALMAIDKLYGELVLETKVAKETVNGKQVEVKRAFVKRDEKDVALVDLVKADYPSLAASLTAETPAAPLPIGTPSRDRPRVAQPQGDGAPQPVPVPSIRF